MSDTRAADPIRVKAESNVRDIASSISHALDKSPIVEVRAIGAGAVCQAAKAVAVARGQVAVKGLDLWTRIGFDTVVSDSGGELSAVVFKVESR